ncbi:hypothetical protein Aros01_09484 [Streptosporangium roseum]
MLGGGVVLVRRVGRPVAAGGEHLDRDELVAVEGVRGAEVVDLAAGLAGAADLDRDLARRAVPDRETPARPGGGERETARAGDPGGRADGQVGEVADRVEDRGPAVQREPYPVALDLARARQGQDQHLLVAGGELHALAGQAKHAEPGVDPPGRLGSDEQRPRGQCRAARGDEGHGLSSPRGPPGHDFPAPRLPDRSLKPPPASPRRCRRPLPRRHRRDTATRGRPQAPARREV